MYQQSMWSLTVCRVSMMVCASFLMIMTRHTSGRVVLGSTTSELWYTDSTALPPHDRSSSLLPAQGMLHLASSTLG